jgi:colicin import membrane protein
VRQIPGGGVVDAQISSPCNASAIVKKSIIDAIRKADPLPYKGFEKVFSRQATFIFKPQD